MPPASHTTEEAAALTRLSLAGVQLVETALSDRVTAAMGTGRGAAWPLLPPTLLPK